MSTDEDLQFHWADYLVAAISLGISIIIGIIAYCRSLKKKNKNEDYLVGSGEMNPAAVGLSIVATALNGVFLLGKFYFIFCID